MHTHLELFSSTDNLIKSSKKGKEKEMIKGEKRKGKNGLREKVMIKRRRKRKSKELKDTKL